MILIAIDPSISCTGVAVFNHGELIQCKKIVPKSSFQKDGIRHTIDAHIRIQVIIDQLAETFADHPEAAFSIEITSGKVNKSRNSSGAGLGTYGMAVGQVVRWAIERVGDDRVHQFYENDWTRGTSKERRKAHAQYNYPLYQNYYAKGDRGMDISDAIMLGDYTIQQMKMGMIGATP